MNRAARDNYPISLLMMDIDHFKSINDRYGHVAGDTCLQYVAGKLRHCLKKGERCRRPLWWWEKSLSQFCLICCRNTAWRWPSSFVEDTERSVIGQSTTPLLCTLSCGIASMVPGSKEDVTLFDSSRRQRTVCSQARGQKSLHAGSTAADATQGFGRSPKCVDRHSCRWGLALNDPPTMTPMRPESAMFPDQALNRHRLRVRDAYPLLCAR